jgi:hypothetical protein
MDFINDAIRILIILDVSYSQIPNKKITKKKILLFDYYLKFPRTMADTQIDTNDFKNNFDEYFAFFHWQPDIAKYENSLSYLISKGLIKKFIQDKDICYEILPSGIEALSKIEVMYKSFLYHHALSIIPEISKLSDSAIADKIKLKNQMLSAKSGGTIR